MIILYIHTFLHENRIHTVKAIIRHHLNSCGGGNNNKKNQTSSLLR